jgi:antirestriction protein ArdC
MEHIMPSQHEIREQITVKIVEALQNGTPPWRKPWSASKNTGFPTNIDSGRRYTGINPLLLEIAAQRHDLRSKYWGTFHQWDRLGGKIKKRPTDVPAGQWGCQIVLYKPVLKQELNKETGEEKEIKYGFLKAFTVFNIDQVEGDHLDKYRSADVRTNTDFIDFEPAETAIAAVGADIRFGGDKAIYRRPIQPDSGDFIQIPHKHQFSQEKEYYATLIHELAHWSQLRLNWNGSYAEGELRAEISACYALTELGVPQSDDLSNHHAYLGSWLTSLQSDPRFIFRAASEASKVVDYLLSFSRQPVIDPAEDLTVSELAE